MPFKVTKSLGADASSDEDEDGDPKPKLGLGPWAAPDFNAHGQAKGIFRWLWALLAGVGMPCMRRSASDTPSLGFWKPWVQNWKRSSKASAT